MQNQPQLVLFGSSSSNSSHHETDPHHQHQINKKSDEDDDNDPETIPNKRIKISNSNSNNNNNISPWQRMKWTDSMVRLLIMAVYYIGDEFGSENNNNNNGNHKKGLLVIHQKKGKWKSVSRAMMEKGFYVSPQQCEDKFNDLNKRYKRVNDILGKGAACKVVENQSLLESMDHLSEKMKEEVRKLLNSKHLFFREMCAYHNSWGHGGGDSVKHNKTEFGIGIDDAAQSQKQEEQEQNKDQEGVFNLGVLNKLGCEELDNDHHCDDNDDDESEDYFDDDYDDDEENQNNDKRLRKLSSSSNSCFELLMEKLRNEVNGVILDGGKSVLEKKNWLKRRIVELEEKQLNDERQAFEIEKKRLKWERFSRKKEREIEKAKLENDKRRLENQRMVLIVQQKEIELKNLQPQQQ